MRRLIRISGMLPLILAALAAPASAQSVFGLNYLGESQFIGSGRYRALALSAYAVFDSSNAVTANIATTADLSRFTFSLVETVSLSSERTGEATAYESRFQFPTVMIGFPVMKGLVFTVGYRTLFEGKGDMTYPIPIEETARGYDVYQHRSGLFAVPFSLAWRPAPWVRIGGGPQFDGGSIRDEAHVIFFGNYYTEVLSTRVRSFSGTSWNASAIVQAHPRLLLAAGLSTEIPYHVDETFNYNRGELDSVASWDLTVPLSWEAGISGEVLRGWWLNAHVFERGAPKPDGFPQLSGSLGAERLIAFGVERRGGQSGGFFSKRPLRFGYYEDRWHLEYPPGRAIASRFFTFGTGFGLPGGPGAADIAFEFGQIGSIGSNGVDERVFRVSFGLSASEAFGKRKTEH